MSPVAALTPMLRALAGPQRPPVVRTLAPYRVAISIELSVELSSTTIRSMGCVLEEFNASRQRSRSPAPL